MLLLASCPRSFVYSYLWGCKSGQVCGQDRRLRRLSWFGSDAFNLLEGLLLIYHSQLYKLTNFLHTSPTSSSWISLFPTRSARSSCSSSLLLSLLGSPRAPLCLPYCPPPSHSPYCSPYFLTLAHLPSSFERLIHFKYMSRSFFDFLFSFLI